jgi:hypothetical protein
MDCKVKEHYLHSDFSLSAINISSFHLDSHKTDYSISMFCYQSVHLAHSITKAIHFHCHCISVVCSKFEADHLITWYNFYRASNFSEIHSHNVLTKQLQFPTYFFKSVELNFPSIINKELLSQKPCWLLPMNH